MKVRLKEQGFTLIEVLVALVASALLVSILLDGAVTAKTRQKNLGLQSNAMVLAQANLGKLRVTAGPASTLTGTDKNLHWSLKETEIASDPRQAFSLVEAQITVGTTDKPKLVKLQKRYLKRLIVS